MWSTQFAVDQLLYILNIGTIDYAYEIRKLCALDILVSDQFWSSTSFGHICFKMFVA